MCHYKKIYKGIVRKKKRLHKIRLSKELTDLKKCKPKDFWKNFSKSRGLPPFDISMEDFKQHFSDVYSDIRSTLNEDVEYFFSVSDLNVSHPTYPELNDDITYGEVKRANNNLNRNKSSCPSDNLLNECFLETSDI